MRVIGRRARPKCARVLALAREHGIGLTMPLYGLLLAEAEAEMGRVEAVLTSLDDLLPEIERTGQGWIEAELHRARGEILLKRDAANPAPAEEAFLTAIAVAKRQATRSFELRAALALAQLYRATGRPLDAHAVLAPALEGFAPTPEMPEIAEADALLAALSQTDEVKAEAAQRQRLTHLQVAYGNALYAARGAGAPETTKPSPEPASRPLATTTPPNGWRLTTAYGSPATCGASCHRCGRMRRPSSATSRRDPIRPRPASPIAPPGSLAGSPATIARRGTIWNVRSPCSNPAATTIWPIASDGTPASPRWPIWRLPRGLSARSIARFRSLTAFRRGWRASTHVGTLAFGRMHAAMLELMRGDHAHAAPNAFELARLAREHDLTLFRACGVFLEGWVTAASGAISNGLQDMRRGVEQLREQNVQWLDGLLKTALAEAEARAGDPNRAVAILDEALATSDRTGCRTFEAELHRVRGEIMLERDPANPAPAEDAFLTAIAVAKRRATRSFELRAALSLAKLYRATGRVADAHAVLAPALEGFSRTPEMPEIAEAEALLARLAESDEVKAATARREGRLKLQVAYGKALMSVRGFGAPETRAAFARASEFAQGAGDASADSRRSTAFRSAPFVARGFAPGREAAEDMLAKSARTGDPAAAGVAHRAMGASCSMAGRLRKQSSIWTGLSRCWKPPTVQSSRCASTRARSPPPGFCGLSRPL